MNMTKKRKIRLTVKPGITGYSQAYFRNNISQEEKTSKRCGLCLQCNIYRGLKNFFENNRDCIA